MILFIGGRSKICSELIDLPLQHGRDVGADYPPFGPARVCLPGDRPLRPLMRMS